MTKEPKPSDSMGVIAKAHKDFYDAFIKVGFSDMNAIKLTMNLITTMMNKANPQNQADKAFWEAIKKHGVGLS